MTGPRSSVAGILTVWAGVIAAVLRLVPHPANFSSVGAMSLFESGALVAGPRVAAWRHAAQRLLVYGCSRVGLDVLAVAPVAELRLFQLVVACGHRPGEKRPGDLGLDHQREPAGQPAILRRDQFLRLAVSTALERSVAAQPARLFARLAGLDDLLRRRPAVLPPISRGASTPSRWSATLATLLRHALGDLAFTCVLFGPARRLNR